MYVDETTELVLINYFEYLLNHVQFKMIQSRNVLDTLIHYLNGFQNLKYLSFET